MRFVVHVTESARIDAALAVSWYEQQRVGLGGEFATEVSHAAEKLEAEALHHAPRFADVRRAGLSRFASYGLFYIVRNSDVVVFALAHAAQNPSWVLRRRNFLP